jgi:hypothetical protein
MMLSAKMVVLSCFLFCISRASNLLSSIKVYDCRELRSIMIQFSLQIMSPVVFQKKKNYVTSEELNFLNVLSCQLHIHVTKFNYK